MTVTQIHIVDNPFPVNGDAFWAEKTLLPCSWITCPGVAPGEPAAMSFSLDFRVLEDDSFRIHVSADQQYKLYLDGIESGRGCEMKSPGSWYFESYDLSLRAGHHTLSAVVWNYGSLSPMNRMSFGPAFILIPQSEPHINLLGTGIASWKTRRLRSFTFNPISYVHGAWMSVAPHERYESSEEALEDISAGRWQAPVLLGKGINGFLRQNSEQRCLRPSPLKRLAGAEIQSCKAVSISENDSLDLPVPHMNGNADELRQCNAALNVGKIIFPPFTTRRIILDMQDYYCAFSRVRVSGGRGSTIRLTWAEAGFDHPTRPEKSDRAIIGGKYFRGVWDEWVIAANQREWSPLAWRCGRFVELLIKTSSEALELESLSFTERRYPLEMDGDFQSNQADINAIVPFCFKTLQMAAHDEFLDCPFYEQLLYAGDGRLESLVNLVACADDTLPRKAITTLALSRGCNGATMARWPSRERQFIPSFSLWWIAMLYDYALWRGDEEFVSSHLPLARNIIDMFLLRCDNSGFLTGVPWEWNFMDWVDDWYAPTGPGTPPGINDSVNASYNWLFVYILRLAEKLERYVGSHNHAQYWRGKADNLSANLQKRFWMPERGVFSEDDSGRSFSEHTQILAILSESLSGSQLETLTKSLLTNQDLAESSIFFKHYLFEALAVVGRPERLLNELHLWNQFLAKGFKTVPETAENLTFNQRSDCHGWGSHPIYHLIANIAGIKPGAMGFRSVRIAPQMGALRSVHAQCVHRSGMISVTLEKPFEGKLEVKIILPPGLTGEFIYEANVVTLEQTETHHVFEEKSNSPSPVRA